ncbi:hypothetical protein EX30DRAFT_368227 [Ascodesmis nigricans]|uniref:Uncharacterized protein n=1 Tax=Ascodesmis nigricans TaxID=341454 RepID=A0A4V3SJS8_9PEZI|nr:hypothetical protein EX30DRAFT_368227 [Ascodesmis nigricans]
MSTAPESAPQPTAPTPSVNLPASDDDRLAIYKAITEYDWEGDQEFQTGLRTILNTAPAEKMPELTLRAKCFFWKRKNGTNVDFTDFKSWIAASNPSHPLGLSSSSSPTPPSDPLAPTALTAPNPTLSALSPPPPPPPSRTITDSTTPSFLPNQKPGEVIATAAPADDDAPYPKSFQEIVDLITSGKPIPGIKEIPDIVKEGEGSKSEREVRRKPWEIAAEKRAEGGLGGVGFGAGLGGEQGPQGEKKEEAQA